MDDCLGNEETLSDAKSGFSCDSNDGSLSNKLWNIVGDNEGKSDEDLFGNKNSADNDSVGLVDGDD